MHSLHRANYITSQIKGQPSSTIELAAKDLLPRAQAQPSIGEGLAIIARHARASQAWVRLAQVGEALEITVRDDGRGFDVEAATRPGHYGLLGMRERVRLAGGTFVIDSAPEHGTRITVRLPLNPVEATQEG